MARRCHRCKRELPLGDFEWSEQRGIPYQTLYARLNRHGWSAERALSTPVRGAR